MEHLNSPHWIFPIGTRVVTLVEARGSDGRTKAPRGAVGVVVKMPVDFETPYRVKFPDGYEAMFSRQEVSLLADYHESTLATHTEYQDRIIYCCIIGSRAYGLETEFSDTDRRGIFLPNARQHWSMIGVPEQLEYDETQEVYWEIQKFVVMALKANPNILECLHSPLVDFATPLAQELLSIREFFISKLVYQTYNGYVLSQFKKMLADLRIHGDVKWKHVMHLLRLLLSGISVLREGIVRVRVDEHRDALLEIRAGHWTWEATEKWRLKLHAEFEAAHDATTLPERPDYARADAFLIRARTLACDDVLP
jgi:uncharacterized protein